jgi:hypothetical protein
LNSLFINFDVVLEVFLLPVKLCDINKSSYPVVQVEIHKVVGRWSYQCSQSSTTYWPHGFLLLLLQLVFELLLVFSGLLPNSLELLFELSHMQLHGCGILALVDPALGTVN